MKGLANICSVCEAPMLGSHYHEGCPTCDAPMPKGGPCFNKCDPLCWECCEPVDQAEQNRVEAWRDTPEPEDEGDWAVWAAYNDPERLLPSGVPLCRAHRFGIKFH